jgi:hypothetical protein
MKQTRRALYVAVLALAGMVTACDQTAQNGSLIGVQQPQAQAPAISYSRIDKRYVQLLSTPTSTVYEYRTSTPVSQWGSKLAFGRYKLEVQFGSLLAPANFVARVTEGENWKVDLFAYDALTGLPVSVFPVPLKLTIGMSDLSVDVSKVFLVYINPDGTYEAVPTTPEPGNKSITSTLYHFSEYSPGTQRTDTTTVEP